MPGEQREVDQREDVVHGVVMLRDAQRPADHPALGSRVRERGIPDDVAGDTRSVLGKLQRVLLDARAVSVEADGGTPDERLIRQPFVNDDPGHRIRERDVRPDAQAKPRVGPCRGRGAARVHDIERRARAHRLEHVMEENRVGVARVRAPEEDDVRFLHFLI